MPSPTPPPPTGDTASPTPPPDAPPPAVEPVDTTPIPPDDERTAVDVEGAPPPGAESGRVDDAHETTSPLRALGQTIMLPPRFALWVAATPVRALSHANERNHLLTRIRGFAFNDDGTYGFYPTAKLQSGFGITVGARFVHRDLFGHKEKLGLYAGYGGRFREIVQGSFKTGRGWGERIALELDGEYEWRPKERFYGIGNADESAPPETLIDPVMSDLAVETRYRQRLARAALTGDLRLVGALSLRASGALTDLEVAASETDPPTDEIYMTDRLNGWEGVRHGYGELELRYDSRRNGSYWDARPIYSAGSLLGVYGGRVTRLDDSGEDFWRYGFDLQHFLRLGPGPRVLLLRAHGEAVSAPRDEVPFLELPSLGRSMYLRGYPTERFRDRVAAAGSAEYQWDLLRSLSASTFVDAGRVFPSLEDLELKDIRVGYGVAFSYFSKTALRARFSIASSIDGGVFFDLSFDPVTDLDGRVERR